MRNSRDALPRGSGGGIAEFRLRAHTAPMRLVVLILVLLLQGAMVAPVLACGCELICPEGEAYSDEHEMCMPVEKPVS